VTGRDKKIVFAVIPVLLVAGCWFLIFGPKRKEAAAASVTQSRAEHRRDQAVAKLNELRAAETRFASDYRSAVRLTRAVPTSLDMPGLIVQLDRAAHGTGIQFDKVAAGDASESAGAGSGGTTQPPSQPGGKAAAGGAQAQTGSGGATESAGNTVDKANAGQPPTGSAPGGGASGAAPVPGLVGVPLQFSFTGSFFRLAEFFQRLDRFVRVANGRLVVRGRLMTVDKFSLTSGEAFPKLTASVNATVYLVPKQEGATNGATATGPSSGSPSSTGSGQVAQSDSTSPSPTGTGATP